MSDLADFLLARIAEDDPRRRPARAQHARRVVALLLVPTWARWSPARVLAECEAKRRIVSFELARADSTRLPADGSHVLRVLALPYADHPDYREEWRP